MSHRAWLLDVAIAAAVLCAVQLEAWQGIFATHRQGPHWAQALGYGIAAAALVVRRVRPLACLVVVCGALALEFAAAGSPEGFGVTVPPMIAAYSVANREIRRRALAGLALVVAFGVWWIVRDPASAGVKQAIWIVPYVAAWLLGSYLRARRLYIEQLLREREEKAATAVAEERTRIARELHDVLGHSVSVMTVQASAVRRLLRPGQDKERSALESVESTGRQALAEMRRVVGVLRRADEEPELAPPPSLANLERLLDVYRHAGLRVEVQGRLDGLTPGLDSTAYRIIQEALTNTLKHAAAHEVHIVLRHRDGALEISIQDDGTGAPPESVPGNGLLGMRERVEVYGGTLDARPSPHGFEVRAVLPLLDDA